MALKSATLIEEKEKECLREALSAHCLQTKLIENQCSGKVEFSTPSQC